MFGHVLQLSVVGGQRSVGVAVGLPVKPPRPRLPSLNALRAFEAAARLESFAKAADEIGVTAGAVTQQIRQLEATLGFAVFRRLPQGVALTDAAREALPRLTRGFDMTELRDILTKTLVAPKAEARSRRRAKAAAPTGPAGASAREEGEESAQGETGAGVGCSERALCGSLPSFGTVMTAFVPVARWKRFRGT